jgi:hypothetical protein
MHRLRHGQPTQGNWERACRIGDSRARALLSCTKTINEIYAAVLEGLGLKYPSVELEAKLRAFAATLAQERARVLEEQAATLQATARMLRES